MRNLRIFSVYRDIDVASAVYGWPGDDTCGAFRVKHPATGTVLLVIASTGEDWDHVSVSLPGRIPNWAEMEFIKRMFFEEDETAMQLHVPAEDHVSLCNSCLHLWRPQKLEIPRPPREMVGPSAMMAWG